MAYIKFLKNIITHITSTQHHALIKNLLLQFLQNFAVNEIKIFKNCSGMSSQSAFEVNRLRNILNNE